MVRWLAALAVVLVTIATGMAAPAGAGESPDHQSEEAPARRVLVFSIPHVSWADIQAFDLPNLQRFFAESAIAGLTTRADTRSTRLADGYLTFGAGTRAVGDPATDGDSFGVDEPFGRNSAGEVYTQRTGREVNGGIVSLADPRILETNEALLYDAEIGSLAMALTEAGIDRAVVGNADGTQPDTPPSPTVSTRRRQAALGVMSRRGLVPRGTVDESLLEPAPSEPFGLRLDEDAVLDAFDEVWADRSVVLVEASDLVRADVYRIWATPIHREFMLRDALKRTDALFGRLLEQVDLSRDAVVVFGPAHAARAITLTPLAVHEPGGEPGLLRSATTRRAGFVQLIDVAPTVLDLLGVDAPTSMEGRPAEVGKTGGSAEDRIDLLVREDAAAQFRDRLVGSVQVAAVIVSALLVSAAMWAFTRRRKPWVVPLVGRAALCVLALIPTVYLARAIPLHDAGLFPYWAFLVLVSIGIGTLYHRLGRDRPLDALLIAFLVNIVLLVGDVLVGTPLEFNSVLGYSPTVAGRFAGFSNPAYAALGASTVLAAPLVARRVGGRRGVWLAVGLMAAVVVVDGAPFWGSDVGGILSMVPAFGITAVLLLGWKVRWRTVGWCVLGLALALGAATALDMSRAPERRTHLGRLVERIDERGLGDFVVIVQRKLADNLGSLRNSVWGFMLLITLVLVVWLVKRAPARLDAVRAAVPEARTGLIGFTVLAVLGYALNDSGIAIPGVMLVILLGAAIWLLSRFEPAESPPSRPKKATTPRARASTS
jgi:hypothetical protein